MVQRLTFVEISQAQAFAQSQTGEKIHAHFLVGRAAEGATVPLLKNPPHLGGNLEVLPVIPPENNTESKN